MKGEKLGEFEELVLLAVYAMGENAYGVTVQRQIESATGRSATLGSVYSALDRLERKEFVRSWMGGGSDERGGRRKRLFEIEPAGKAALERMREARESLWRLVEPSDG